MSVPRLHVHRPDAKRESDARARRREHADAFAVATGRITRHVTDVVGKPGMRLQEEIGSGSKRGPFELAELLVEVAREFKPEADAAAPLRVLARRLGYDLVPAREGDGEADVVSASADAGKEFGEALGAALALVRSRFLTIPARDRARREIAEAQDALHRVAGEVEELFQPPGRPRRVEVGR